MKFRKKPIEAFQWFKNGDHPQDGVITREPEGKGETEGKAVRRFRHPDIPETNICNHCGVLMRYHGWIDVLDGGHQVCPADWIITGPEPDYPVKPDIFEATYELAPD